MEHDSPTRRPPSAPRKATSAARRRPSGACDLDDDRENRAPDAARGACSAGGPAASAGAGAARARSTGRSSIHVDMPSMPAPLRRQDTVPGAPWGPLFPHLSLSVGAAARCAPPPPAAQMPPSDAMR